MHAKNSNETTVGMFPNFNLLCGRYTLLPIPSALTSLCALAVCTCANSSIVFVIN